MRLSMVSKPVHPSSIKSLTKQLIFTKTRNDNLFGIKNLNLWGNDLQDLSLIQEMPNLEVISLSVNNIKTLKYFQNCHKLQELYLRKNDIKTLSEIEYLVDLKELRVLWLCDNPCANNRNYREIVIRSLPALTKLDNDVITLDEKDLNGVDRGGDEGYGDYEEDEDEGLDRMQEKFVKYDGRSMVMPNENIYQSNKSKANNYLSQLNENQSRFHPNSRNSPDRKQNSNQYQHESPHKVISNRQNQNQRPMSHEIDNQIERDNHSMMVGSNRKMSKNADKMYDEYTNAQEEKFARNGEMVHQGFNRYYEQQHSKRGPQQMPLKNQLSSKHPYSSNNQSNISSHNRQVHSNTESERETSIKPSYESSQKQNQLSSSSNKSSHLTFPQKGSSPNIIMAIMSLLDDLDTDGLEIIRRETQRKIGEQRYGQNNGGQSSPQRRHK